MQTPIKYRKEIPFFYNKSEQEFRQDAYERYEEMVVRQSALHLADVLWEMYPMQAILDFANPYYPNLKAPNVLEMGCGVGRWVATLAQKYPKATCWGMDYSYQMLKRAQEFWVKGKQISIDWSHKGFERLEQKGYTLDNLHFGLAKAEQLPFSENSQDIVLHSFLLDRLEYPQIALKEMYRVLKPRGSMIGVTPLNFNKVTHWKHFYPPIKIRQLLEKIGFNIITWDTSFVIKEPLDRHGNSIRWNCLGFVVHKN